MSAAPVGSRFRLLQSCLLLSASLTLAACRSAKDGDNAPPAAPAAAAAAPATEPTAPATASAAPATTPAAPAPAPAAAPAAPPGETLVLVPGRSLGPIALDMEEQDLKALGLEVRSPGEGFLLVGPYVVALKDGRVESASVELSGVAASVALEDKTLDQTMTLEAAAAAIGGCGDPTDNVGASIVECRDGTVSVTRGGRSETITSVGIAKAR